MNRALFTLAADAYALFRRCLAEAEAADAADLRAMILAACPRVGVDLDVPIRNVGGRHSPIWSPDLSALPGGLPR